MGEFTTTANAPCASASCAITTERMPRVVPPPTPTKTGLTAALMTACEMACCGVNG